MTKTDTILDYVKSVTDAADAQLGEQVQQLWSGYGHISRIHLHDAQGAARSVIVKAVNPPSQTHHPRGWNTPLSHQRKLRSYEVETTWYNDWAAPCQSAARVATCYGCATIEDIQIIVLEDLDRQFPRRLSGAKLEEAMACLCWLGRFHARFMGCKPNDLWPVGTYWHLSTRQDEFAAMPEGELKEAATALDKKLSGCHYQSLVHGDAKIANFCFAPPRQMQFDNPASDRSAAAVAAVDFQYVGGGCGMKDVVYFIGSCLSESDCEAMEGTLLEGYFASLSEALEVFQPQVDAQLVIEEWRNLYAIAWTDFYRFLAGWMPDHPKVHAYTRQLAQRALREL